MSVRPLRRVLSFVRRDSRMTDAQRQAFEIGWPIFGLEPKGLLDFAVLFKEARRLALEIGFGSGQSLAAMASTHPEQDFVGIETHKPGIGALFQKVLREGLQNIRVFYADAVQVLKEIVPDESFHVIQIFFPDPWPKRRHHKRRLIQAPFVDLLVSKLKPEGALHLATDWEDYAKQMMRVLSQSNGLVNAAGVGQFAGRSLQRPLITKFEQRGQIEGRPIWELQFTKSFASSARDFVE